MITSLWSAPLEIGQIRTQRSIFINTPVRVSLKPARALINTPCSITHGEGIHESLGYKTPYEIYFKKLLEQQLKQAA